MDRHFRLEILGSMFPIRRKRAKLNGLYGCVPQVEPLGVFGKAEGLRSLGFQSVFCLPPKTSSLISATIKNEPVMQISCSGPASCCTSCQASVGKFRS